MAATVSKGWENANQTSGNSDKLKDVYIREQKDKTHLNIVASSIIESPSTSTK